MGWTEVQTFFERVVSVLTPGGLVIACAILPQPPKAAQPSNKVKAMPLMARVPMSSSLAGTSRRTHSPSLGRAPLARRLGLLFTPQAIRSSPQ